MPGTGFIFCVLLFFFCNISKADPPGHFVVVGGGVIVYTNAPFTGNSTAVKLQVIAPNIVRVIAAPGKELAPSKSLITIFEKDPKLVWNVLGKEKNYAQDSSPNRCCRGQNAEFTLYEDEDVNYNYEKGAHSSIRINYTETSKTLPLQIRPVVFQEC